MPWGKVEDGGGRLVAVDGLVAAAAFALVLRLVGQPATPFGCTCPGRLAVGRARVNAEGGGRLAAAEGVDL